MPMKRNIIDIIFPATSCLEGQIVQIKNYIKNLGFEPRILHENLTTPKKDKNCQLPNFSAQNRFNQLYDALKAPDSCAIWCGSGGFGSADLLPFLANFAPVKQNKMFIGFSDITSIDNFLQNRWGWQIISAPMPVQMIDDAKLKIEPQAKAEIEDVILGKKQKFTYQLQPLNDAEVGDISAPIIGGCLSVLCGNFGTDFQIDFADQILFLEDEKESAERLDRYFSQVIFVILRRQRLQKNLPKAILISNLYHGIDGAEQIANIDKAVANFVNKITQFGLKIPVFKTKDNLGHNAKMRPLILGSKSVIDVQNAVLAASF